MKYYIDKPYPKITSIQENPNDGAMILSNIGGLHSEMSAVSLYFYNAIILKYTHSQLAEAMKQISIVEMHHLEIFCELAYLLGVDPRLWECHHDHLDYWSPGYNVYPCQIEPLLENAIIQEKNTIAIYEYQCACLYNQTIVAILQRIIEDEQLHVKIFQSFLDVDIDHI